MEGPLLSYMRKDPFLWYVGPLWSYMKKDPWLRSYTLFSDNIVNSCFSLVNSKSMEVLYMYDVVVRNAYWFNYFKVLSIYNDPSESFGLYVL